MRRAQIIVSIAAGRGANETADIIGCARSHVYTILTAFDQNGWLALLDGRRENGGRKADENFRRVVRNLVDQSPRDDGFIRPTWTRELLAIVAKEQTDVQVSVCVMGQVLRAIRARRGRPKPIVEGDLFRSSTTQTSVRDSSNDRLKSPPRLIFSRTPQFFERPAEDIAYPYPLRFLLAGFT